MKKQSDQTMWRRIEKHGTSLAGLRPGPIAFLAVLLVVIAAFGARAGFVSSPDAQPQAAAPSAKAAPADKSGDKAAQTDKKKDTNGYVWLAIRKDSEIRLRGAVPSEEDRSTMLGMVKAHFPDLKVDDGMKVVAGGPTKEQWLGAVNFGLQQLAHLKRGSVRLVDIGLQVSGVARNANDYAEIKKALSGPLPQGLTVSADGVRAPVADPFVFTADLGVNALSLAGSVPSEDARKHLRELSRQLFERPGLDDRLEVASGAPKNWDEAVTAALRALSRLESGKIAMSGLAVTIEGVAPDKGTAVAVSYQLRRDLPKLFSTSESIKWKEANASQDIAAQVIPRIKSFARMRDDDEATGTLPPLEPLLDAE